MGSLADALLSHRAPPDNLNNSLLRQIVRLQETLAVANAREQNLVQQLHTTEAEAVTSSGVACASDEEAYVRMRQIGGWLSLG